MSINIANKCFTSSSEPKYENYTVYVFTFLLHKRYRRKQTNFQTLKLNIMGTLLAILGTVFLISIFGWPAFIILFIIGFAMTIMGA